MNTSFKATVPRTTAANTTVLLASADSRPEPDIGLAARLIPAPQPPLRAFPLPAARRLRRLGFLGRCRVEQARVRFAELRERGGAGDAGCGGFLCGGRSESGGELEWEWECERDGKRGDCEE